MIVIAPSVSLQLEEPWLNNLEVTQATAIKRHGNAIESALTAIKLLGPVASGTRKDLHQSGSGLFL